MATPVTSAKPSVPKPEPHSAVKDAANRSLAEIKAGSDPLRVPRYIGKFVSGTVTHGLNGLANWARKGMWAGGSLGILVGIATPWGLGAVIAGAAIGFAAAGAIGAVKGLATGGMNEVNRQRRGEKYADDLIVRDTMQKNAPARTADYRAYHRANQQHTGYVVEQILQREKEYRQEESWAAREAHRQSSHHDHGAGRGF